VHWRLVNSLLSETTQQMKDLEFAFKKAMSGTISPSALSITCADKINNLLGYAVSYKYIETNFDEQAKTEVFSQL